jgi:hypothetical protein
VGNRTFAIKALEEKGNVIIRCNGNSMRPIIAPQEAIHLIKVSPVALRVGDAVFVKVNGNLQVHKIGAVRNNNEEFRIENNKGHVNGWVGSKSIFGLAVQIEDRVLVSEKDLEQRFIENEKEKQENKTSS